MCIFRGDEHIRRGLSGMTGYGRVGHRMAVVWRGSLVLVIALLLMPVLNTGSVTAAGTGPVFSNLQASGSDVEAGSIVFLTVHLASSADIVGNPMISFLFPDGTPGPAVTFSRVGGTLQDGDWQASLELSEYLPSGTYEINNLRAVDAASNVTVYDPDADAANTTNALTTSKLRAINVTGSTNGEPLEQTGGSAPKTTNLTVTNTAQTPKDIGTVSDITKLTASSSIQVVPSECLYVSHPPNGPFFTTVYFTPTKVMYAPGERITANATIVDCGIVGDDLAGAEIRLQYSCSDGTKKDGPFATWLKARDFDFLTNPKYTATLELFKSSPCKGAYSIGIKELRAFDRQGYDNRFTPDKPFWPAIAQP